MWLMKSQATWLRRSARPNVKFYYAVNSRDSPGNRAAIKNRFQIETGSYFIKVPLSYISWSTWRQPPACSLKLPPKIFALPPKNPNFPAATSWPSLPCLVDSLANIFPASVFLGLGETWPEPKLLPALVLSCHHFLKCANPEFIHGLLHCYSLHIRASCSLM